jgi:hypothetical protein
MSELSRRDFTRGALASVLTYSILETLFENDAFAAEIRPTTAKWVTELNEISADVKSEKLKQVLWQRKVEDLFAHVDLPDLLRLVDFDRLTKNLKIRDKGETSLRFGFQKIDGVPTKLVFGKQIFALKKGRSVIPHGHNNMATGFLILKGKLQGRHYDRVEDQPKHLIIRPTVDRKFDAGESSTVSDYRDNIHWFTALSEDAYIFNIHVLGLKRPGPRLRTGRVYVDPEGEKLKGGLIRAPRLGYSEVKDKYG